MILTYPLFLEERTSSVPFEVSLLLYSWTVLLLEERAFSAPFEVSLLLYSWTETYYYDDSVDDSSLPSSQDFDSFDTPYRTSDSFFSHKPLTVLQTTPFSLSTNLGLTISSSIFNMLLKKQYGSFKVDIGTSWSFIIS